MTQVQYLYNATHNMHILASTELQFQQIECWRNKIYICNILFASFNNLNYRNPKPYARKNIYKKYKKFMDIKLPIRPKLA